METIDILVIMFASLAALTKLIDVVSTIKRVTCATEINPIGRILFRRFGVAGGCWMTFAFEVLVCAAVAWGAIFYSETAEKIAIIVVYGILTYFNVSTGLYNMKGYCIPFTKSIIRFYIWLGQKV